MSNEIEELRLGRRVQPDFVERGGEGPIFDVEMLSAEDVALLGPLTLARAKSRKPVDLAQGIYEFAMWDMRGDLRKSENPLTRVKGWAALRRGYQLMIAEGHGALFGPVLAGLQKDLDRIGAAARGRIVMKLMTANSDEVEGIMQAVVDLVEAGAWPGHELGRLQMLLDRVEACGA
jgi:hypothetical protein